MADQRKQILRVFKKPEEGQKEEMQKLMSELKERKEQRREGPFGTYKVIDAAEAEAVRKQARKTLQEM